MSTIKDVVIAITYRCNSRCRMCNIWQIKEHNNEFKSEYLFNLPKSVRDVNISGGEPFLRADIFDVIRNITERCPEANIIISTNGFATQLILEKTKELLKIKKDLGVAISIDGMSQVHNQVRGIEGGFDKAMATLKGLRELGVKSLKLSFTLADYNSDELPKVYELADNLGAELSLTIIHSSENFFNADNKIADSSKMIQMLDWLIAKELRKDNLKNWARAYFAYGAKRFIQTGKRILPDYSGESNIFIDPQGAIYPCDISSQKIGDLKNEQIVTEKADRSCAQSWMVCTARQAIKKHWIKVGLWIVINRMKLILKKA